MIAACSLVVLLTPAASTVVSVEYECGDLDSCRYLNDGECDDGGPTAVYWECPRFSDATDCGTLCDAHSGALPPPPPSCDLEQWASSAEASSSYSEYYGADQATGAPSHPMTCTPGRTGSWAPGAMTADDNWLATYYEQPVYVTAVLVFEHANPPDDSGFVTAVDLRTASGEWVEGAWQLDEDPTECGGVLTLRADEAALPLDDLVVTGCRVHTRTDRTDYGAWEYIDAVKLVGTLCNGTSRESIPRTPTLPPLPSPAPSPPKTHVWPPPLPHLGTGPSLPGAPPPSPPVGWLTLVQLPEYVAMVLLCTTFFVCVCCWFVLVGHCRRAAVRRRDSRLVAPYAPTAPPAEPARHATLLTASAVQRATRAPPGCELVSVALHKPQSATRLGINLADRADADDAGAAAEVVVEALAPGSVAAGSGVLRPGDAVAAVNGCVPASAAEAVLMLQQAEGTLTLELLRRGGGDGAGAAPTASDARREAFLRENPFLVGGARGGAPAVAPAAPTAAAAVVGGAPASASSSSAAAAAAAAAAARRGEGVRGRTAAIDDAGPSARPWTPRTVERQEAELSAAIGAAVGGERDGASRLVAASKRAHDEAAALRKELAAKGARAAGGAAGAARESGGAVDPLEVPAQFRCPISQELMEDPVTTSDGHTYERREIFRWLCTHSTSPLTGAPLPNKALTPAIALRQLISTFVAENPGLA